MTSDLLQMRLVGAQILREGEMRHGSICFDGDRIMNAPFPEVDLSGYFILPGIIDLHGDGFERHMAPRPSATFPVAAGFASFDREAAAHGVTTAYLAQGWSWEGGQRGPDHAEVLMAALEEYRPHALTDLRIQIRAETHMVDATSRLIAAVRRFGVGYVIFNNHLDEGMQMARQSPTDFAAWARKVGKSSEELTSRIESAFAQSKFVPRSLCSLAEAFDALGIIYGSHDDPDGETRERYLMIGAKVAEFPLSRRAAVAAHAMNSPVVMGAPNVVRGQSQAGNVSARSLLADGFCDALVSDYHIPALPLAVWALVDGGFLDLPKAWALVSTNPADILGMPDRGRLDLGLRADMVIVNAQTRGIEATICGGRVVYLAGQAAHRFMAHRNSRALAAE